MSNYAAFTVTIVTTLPADQQKSLYLAEGWCDEQADPADLAAVVRGSFLVSAAFAADGSLVGMARMISDGAGDAYIQDVVVRSDYRGRGVGSAVVSVLADAARRKGIRWIGLVAAPGMTPFYEKLGFREMKDHIPMLMAVDDGPTVR